MCRYVVGLTSLYKLVCRGFGGVGDDLWRSGAFFSDEQTLEITRPRRDVSEHGDEFVLGHDLKLARVLCERR